MRKKVKLSKRQYVGDPRYNSETAMRFVLKMMHDGKRFKMLKNFYEALDLVEKKLERDGYEVFLKALDNVKPVVEVKSRRIGGSTYQIPVEVAFSRRESLGMRWLIQAARTRSGRGIPNRLASELMDAFNLTGGAVKKKDDIHKMAESNRAFAHYRW